MMLQDVPGMFFAMSLSVAGDKLLKKSVLYLFITMNILQNINQQNQGFSVTVCL